MKILYINLNSKNTRDKVTINGLKKNNVQVEEIVDDSRGTRKLITIVKKIKASQQYDHITVGFTGIILVPFVKFFSKTEVSYNALGSFYESMIISRQEKGFLFLKALYYYFLDKIAFFVSDFILVESESQKRFISKTFLVNPKKIIVHLTGVSEKDFFFNPKVKKLLKFTAVFRGKFLPESGIFTIIEAAKLLEKEKINIRILGHGLLEKKVAKKITELNLMNIELITEKLPINEIRKKMQECQVSIGQVADHPRLKRTIPHKAFESIALKLPYLTARTEGILELLKEGESAICINPADARDLAKKLVYLKENPEILLNIGLGGFRIFEKKCREEILGKKLLEAIKKLNC